MKKVKVYNLEGKESGEIGLDPKIFDVEINQGLVHQAVEVQMANRRQLLAHTKDRSEVRGGGRKPWRQKGTGRARHGSSRSPIWKGGGVTFGPRNERVFEKKINKKMKRNALCMTLTDKVKENKFIVVESLELAEAKTKKMTALLQALPVQKESALLVIPKQDQKIVKSVNNISWIKSILADSLNVVDILGHSYIITDKAAVQKIVETYK